MFMAVIPSATEDPATTRVTSVKVMGENWDLALRAGTSSCVSSLCNQSVPCLGTAVLLLGQGRGLSWMPLAFINMVPDDALLTVLLLPLPGLVSWLMRVFFKLGNCRWQSNWARLCLCILQRCTCGYGYLFIFSNPCAKHTLSSARSFEIEGDKLLH